jgi:hypothetical protein
MQPYGKSSKLRVMTGTAFTHLTLPSGVPVPMHYCGDPYKIAKSDKEEIYNQRYWMCDNYAFNSIPYQIRIGLMVRILIICLIFLTYEILVV